MIINARQFKINQSVGSNYKQCPDQPPNANSPPGSSVTGTERRTLRCVLFVFCFDKQMFRHFSLFFNVVDKTNKYSKIKT